MQVLYRGQVTDLSDTIHLELVRRCSSPYTRRDLDGSAVDLGEILDGGWLEYTIAEIGFPADDGPEPGQPYKWRYLDPTASHDWHSVVRAFKIAILNAYKSPATGTVYFRSDSRGAIDAESLEPIIEMAASAPSGRPLKPIIVIHKGHSVYLASAVQDELQGAWNDAYLALKRRTPEESAISNELVWGELSQSNRWLKSALGGMIFKRGEAHGYLSDNLVRLCEAILDEIKRQRGVSIPDPFDLDTVQFDSRISPLIDELAFQNILNLIQGP